MTAIVTDQTPPPLTVPLHEAIVTDQTPPPLTVPLDECILHRHSSRRFLSTTVPKDLIHSALELAQHAPSNSNIQPWRLYLLTGSARDRLAHALVTAASATIPNIPPLPATFTHFRSELGKLVYGVGMGIPRDDTAARTAAVLRNYDFFGAPVAGIVCMNKALGYADAVSVGMWLQTFLLGLTEREVDSCVEVSVAGYPEVIRKELGIGDDVEILCGLAVGYEDKAFKANVLRINREGVEKNVVMLDV